MLAACSLPDAGDIRSTGGSGLQEDAKELAKGLIGEWSAPPEQDGTVFHEQWESTGDQGLKGIGFVMLGSDTVSIEHLAIQFTDSGTFYTARIPSQNNGRPVHFELTSASDSLVFEYPERDFPDRIMYRPVGHNGWIARVSGKGERTIVFELGPREQDPPHR